MLRSNPVSLEIIAEAQVVRFKSLIERGSEGKGAYICWRATKWG